MILVVVVVVVVVVRAPLLFDARFSEYAHVVVVVVVVVVVPRRTPWRLVVSGVFSFRSSRHAQPAASHLLGRGTD